MEFGKNLQYLRRRQGNMTQEKLADMLGISRQTVSKWESGEVCPDVSKLLELCGIFSCSMDDLLQTDLAERNRRHTPVRLVRVQGFQYASQLIISKTPREDSQNLLSRWCRRSGVDSPVSMGWAFPYVSQEQKERFGLRGYVSAVVLPQDFEVWVPGPELERQETADYAVMTLPEPTRYAVSHAYEMILAYLDNTPGINKKHSAGILPTFQCRYEKDGTEYLDLYVHCQCTRAPDAAVNFAENFTR